MPFPIRLSVPVIPTENKLVNSLFEVFGNAMKEIAKLPVSIVAYVALIGVIMIGMLSFGGVPLIFGGFARADRVNRIAIELNQHVAQIAKDDNSHWANQTATALLRMDQDRCGLASGPLRNLYDQLIQSRQNEYYNLTGQYYPLPSCGDL